MIVEQFVLSLNNPVISSHKVYGQEILPGLAYIDLIYQVFRKNNYDYNKLELRNLSIFSPLAAGKDYSLLLTVRCKEQKDQGLWQVSVDGQEKRNDKVAAEKKCYVTAQMHQVSEVCFNDLIDPRVIKASASAVRELEDTYRQMRAMDLVHSGFIKAQGNIYETDAATYIDVRLGEAAMPTASSFLFHPTLIDASAAATSRLLEALAAEEHRLFLPIFYESFSAAAPLHSSCIAKVEHASVVRKKDLLYLTLEFYNEEGFKVAELKQFTNKLVREAGLINTERLKQETSREVISQTPANTNGIYKTNTDNIVKTAEGYLKELIGAQLGKQPGQIDTAVGYYEMGLDSARLLAIVRLIEENVGAPLSPTLLFEYTSIAELAQHLSSEYPHKFGSGEAQEIAQQENVRSKAIPPQRTSKQEHQPSFSNTQGEEEIAIISLAGRFPGAENMAEFWENLKQGKDCITEVPSARWDYSQYYDEDKELPGKSPCKWGGFMSGVEMFDPLFFNISPKEAAVMDPMQRLFLETVWVLLEGAGYTRENIQRRYQSKVGVFVGAMYQQYNLLNADLPCEAAAAINSYSFISNRVSSFFNLQGPSIAIDTMCSSALISIHMACDSLRKGECRMAVAGGVNLSIHPKKYIGLSQAQILSSSHRNRSFGNGDGYIPSEGVGAVLLKPLSNAIADKDNILAVIKSSAINHNGFGSGFTVPNPNAQAELIENNFKQCGIDPRTISYVESSANGSSMGDLIEVTALNKVFQKYASEKQFCSIGSVKSNMGHPEAVSGIAQLGKVVLQMQHKLLVPSIRSEALNENIHFEKSPFYLQEKLSEWKQPVLKIEGEECMYPRRATVSSFAAGGSNAHLILEEYIIPQEELLDKDICPRSELILFSAKTEERLQVMVEQMFKHLNSLSGFSLSSLAYTLQTGREPMEYRIAIVVPSAAAFLKGLQAFINGEDEPSISVFKGSPEDSSRLKGFINSRLSDSVVSMLLTENNLTELAEYWVSGGKVNWELLGGREETRTMWLPTYPFAKRPYWISGSVETVTPSKKTVFQTSLRHTADVPPFNGPVQDFITRFFCQELGFKETEVKPDKNIQIYGASSLTYMKFVRAVDKTYGIKLNTRDLIEHPSILSLAELIGQKICKEAQEINEDTLIKSGADDMPVNHGLRVLEKFRTGAISLEEIQKLIEQGEVL